MTKLPGDPCPVCNRAGGWATIHIPNQPLAQVCSSKCAEIFIRAKGEIKMQECEKNAIKIGGNKAGEYLDRINKTDLATLTPVEWAEFCGIMFKETCEELRRIADDEIPF